MGRGAVLVRRYCDTPMAAETARAASPDISHRSAESAKGVVPQPVEGCEVVAAFDGRANTSDAGALLLGATDRAIGLMSRFAGCFHARAASGQAAAPPSGHRAQR